MMNVLRVFVAICILGAVGVGYTYFWWNSDEAVEATEVVDEAVDEVAACVERPGMGDPDWIPASIGECILFDQRQDIEMITRGQILVCQRFEEDYQTMLYSQAVRRDAEAYREATGAYPDRPGVVEVRPKLPEIEVPEIQQSEELQHAEQPVGKLVQSVRGKVASND